MSFRLECRFFSGYKPCAYMSGCEGCAHYLPMGTRILIVKLGAIGDALRTTPILSALKGKYNDCFITWITDEASYPILKGNLLIDRLMILNFKSYLTLKNEHFHLVLNFDKEKEALAFAEEMKGEKKGGFRLSPEGKLTIYNDESSYAYELGLFDDLKFRRNEQSYQEIIFQMAGLAFTGQEYDLRLERSEIEFGERYLEKEGLRRPGDLLVGFNTGCGEIFATKKWTIAGFADLAELLHKKLHAKILLLGGPGEKERNRLIKERISFKVHNTGSDNSLKEFASIISLCDLVVTADTTALHIALALKVPVVALFGSTCHQEIYLYGRGEKVISDFPCSPCYRGRCEKKPTCMESMTAGQVYEKAEKILGRSKRTE